MFARKFFNDFCFKVKENEDELKECYNNSPEFTKAIIEGVIEPAVKKSIQCILNVDEGNIGVDNEYYRIDVCGWIQRKDELDENIFPELKKHLWELLIAVEHENNRHDWTDELVKLAFIRCPLKVIVGYNDYGSVGKEEKVLKYALDILRKIKYSNGLPDDEMLIIFGDTAVSDSIDYRGYLYSDKSGEFNRIVRDEIV